MSMPLRASVASLICPFTPFLLPRLARPSIRLSATWLQSTRPVQRVYVQQRGLKISKHKIRARQALERKAEDELEDQQRLVKDFEAACSRRAVSRMTALYPQFTRSPLLRREHTRLIANALHNALRTRHASQEDRENLSLLVERLVQDIRSGTLPPHPRAHVHVLGIYKLSKKYDEGMAFWQWLVRRDDTHLDPAVYGAAIELMAEQGSTKLADLENLYTEAIKRFPGTFAEYHLSPDAIVPDRTQSTSISGLPVILLQGILTARMYARDWTRAYLALDTVLRLYPTQTPSRFFELFIFQRPIAEAYSVFMIACRSGQLLKPSILTTILAELGSVMKFSSTLEDRVTLLRAMGDVIYAYLEAGGSIEGPHIGSFLNAFGRLLNNRPFDLDYKGDESLLRDSIVRTAHDTVSALIQAGMPPHSQVFVSLLNLAGLYRVPSLLESTLQDIAKLQLDLGPIGRRNALLSCGSVRNPDLVKQHWLRIVSQAEAGGEQIVYDDWVTFARACQRAELGSYFNEQAALLSHTLTTRTLNNAVRVLEEPELGRPLAPLPLMAISDFDENLQKISGRMRDVAAIVMSGQPLDFNNTPFSVFLDPHRRLLAPPPELRAVYDVLTTDPHQPPPPAIEGSQPLPVRKSSTGLPLDELRFQNWVAIMELMSEAEASEAEFQRRLDKAIAEGRRLEKMPYVMSFRKPMDSTEENGIEDAEERQHRLRIRVRELRTPPSLSRGG
ncbi:hypothetical protein EJ04DRAFT_576159 [Polyplosphaeria fusca]|uniref:Uncharacterized protein n=1 Tax=Polyplosphaeria fusca TaxID=682080 RepID=A0A9P4V3I0_9PLEO|nr:hypothetical protein EJ04DRAFT_576159 [Polyplosphaeria fusca]